MAKEIKVDIKENRILALDSTLLNILLKDNSSGNNIIWATDNYSQYGEAYAKDKHITVFSVTGKNGNIIKPRTEKSKEEQAIRVRDKAEVFTPSWICNKQNNLVDNAWFGRENVFNWAREYYSLSMFKQSDIEVCPSEQEIRADLEKLAPIIEGGLWRKGLKRGL